MPCPVAVLKVLTLGEMYTTEDRYTIPVSIAQVEFPSPTLWDVEYVYNEKVSSTTLKKGVDMTERLGMHREVQPALAIFWGFKIIRDIRCEMFSKRNENGWGAGQEGDVISKSILFQWQTRFFFCCWLQMTTNSFHLKKFYNLPATIVHVDIWRSRGNTEKKTLQCWQAGQQLRLQGHRQNDLICGRLWWTGIKTGSLKAGKGHLALESKDYFIRK